jgi:purine-binding chemotaxis protein CheW
VEVAGANGSIMMGIVVDAVSEVLNIRGADIENTPAFGVQLNTDFILGMAKAAGGIKILLDIDKVLGNGDMSFLAS